MGVFDWNPDVRGKAIKDIWRAIDYILIGTVCDDPESLLLYKVVLEVVVIPVLSWFFFLLIF